WPAWKASARCAIRWWPFKAPGRRGGGQRNLLGENMIKTQILGGAAAALSVALGAAAFMGPAHAAEPVKIGFIATLSTPAGYIGEDERDAFNLAIKQGGGTL